MKTELQAKVDFLKRPSSYAEGANSIECKETHASWVFMTDNFVYKLKKPVHFAYLDHRTLEARHLSANQEIFINQTLAPEIYIGVVPLSVDAANQLHINGGGQEGRIVDWLVKMKRIPDGVFMDNAALNENVSKEAVYMAAKKLSEFYQRANVISIKAQEYTRRLRQNIEESYQVLSSPVYQLPKSKVQAIYSAQMALLEESDGLFDQRVSEKRIIDGHGDLRPEHICLTSPPLIIDRVEFDPKLRQVDPLDELSFLAIELELLGRTDLEEVFYSTYYQETGDRASTEIIRFYKSYRACLRAKLSAWHLDDPQVNNKEKWKKRTSAYLELAKVICG